MSGSTHNGTYGNQGGPSPWGPGPYAGPGYWQWHHIPKPLLIAGMVIGFILWWPVGLAMLIYMICTGRMAGCWGRRQRGFYQDRGGWQPGAPPWADWKGFWGGGSDRPPQSSGNHAFDEYRMETLRRLEEEQKEFATFLERLRFAKDKAEFDQFMADRRNHPPAPPTEPPAQPQA